MDDLVQRLKTHAEYHGDHASSDIELAADTITTLTAALEWLVKAERHEVHGVECACEALAAARAALREVGRG